VSACSPREKNVSTVLWSNLLENGKVSSDESDKTALYKYADKLDSIAKKLGLGSFLDICDTTDVRFNNGDFELPAGMESTDEVMAKEGAWIPANDAEKLLAGILTHVQQQKIRFGLLSNNHDEVVQELSEALNFVKTAKSSETRFNFSIVT
jgi:hypothetical protein